MTGITRHVVGCCYPVANLVLSNPFAYCCDFARNLMSKYKRRLMNTVPFHYITAAYAARHDLHEPFASADLRYRHLFDPDVPVIVVHCHAHRWQNISICPKKNLYPGLNTNRSILRYISLLLQYMPIDIITEMQYSKWINRLKCSNAQFGNFHNTYRQKQANYKLAILF